MAPKIHESKHKNNDQDSWYVLKFTSEMSPASEDSTKNIWNEIVTVLGCQLEDPRYLVVANKYSPSLRHPMLIHFSYGCSQHLPKKAPGNLYCRYRPRPSATVVLRPPEHFEKKKDLTYFVNNMNPPYKLLMWTEYPFAPFLKLLDDGGRTQFLSLLAKDN
jgi:hypothetical protein